MAGTWVALTRVAQYSEHYRHVFLSAMRELLRLIGRSGELDSPQSVGIAWFEDPVFALASVTWYGFSIQDPTQRYWRLAARAIGEAASRGGLYAETLPEGVRQYFEYLCRTTAAYPLSYYRRRYPLEHLNKGFMLTDLARLHLKSENIIQVARDQLLCDASRAHFTIKANVRGMGDQATSSVLRDVAWVYDLAAHLEEEHPDQAVYIQPISMKVRRIAESIWPDLRGKRDWRAVSHHIVSGCRKANVSSIRFNQGALYLGAYGKPSSTSEGASTREPLGLLNLTAPRTFERMNTP